MTQFPWGKRLGDMPLGKKAALQWASEHFREVAVAEYLRYGGTKKAELQNRVKMLRAGFLSFDSDDDIVALVKDADDGDEAANTILLEAAATIIDEQYKITPLSAWGPLKEFVVRFLRNPQQTKRRRGRKHSPVSQRDSLISYAVWQVSLRWGFPVTRNVASRDKGHSSATSIVKEALETVGINLSEDNIVKIRMAEKRRLGLETKQQQ